MRGLGTSLVFLGFLFTWQSDSEKLEWGDSPAGPCWVASSYEGGVSWHSVQVTSSGPELARKSGASNVALLRVSRRAVANAPLVGRERQVSI